MSINEKMIEDAQLLFQALFIQPPDPYEIKIGMLMAMMDKYYRLGQKEVK
jgi:hypothetical protein